MRKYPWSCSSTAAIQQILSAAIIISAVSSSQKTHMAPNISITLSVINRCTGGISHSLTSSSHLKRQSASMLTAGLQIWRCHNGTDWWLEFEILSIGLVNWLCGATWRKLCMDYHQTCHLPLQAYWWCTWCELWINRLLRRRTALIQKLAQHLSFQPLDVDNLFGFCNALSDISQILAQGE